ncbi:hypothetical protein AWU65_06185 [Paenibacillus glucanolyticus]|uniref:Activator of Hsp90 ATPase homologue 1/2-like C-terminal domain-containing protein n=1 Tax=Paenibacillus glucanolyticus TaxID=59843 RepID=A0A163HL14_9BACL|nr:SRPBCC domain-containing protein [Paenibacillus glucanolyticus]KZS45538.1 hypothetical protein AWU65_06185 [Paenibacillus glucanolyticus]
MEITMEVYIEADIEDVFPYVNNDEKIKLWNTLMIENIYHSDAERNCRIPGTRYTSVQQISDKTYRAEAEILEFNPPYLVSVGATTKEGYSTTRYILSRSGSGTLVQLHSSTLPSNLFYKILIKLLGGWSTRLVWKGQFDNLKKVAEQTQYPLMKPDRSNS